MNKSISALLIILFGLGVWSFLFFRLFYIAEYNNPGITEYGYPININNDYYAYLYFIKSGLEGKLYFENVFTDISQPKQITEPHYFLVGFLARPLGLSAVDIFFLLRIISPCLFIIVFIYLVRKIIDVWWGQILALIFLFFSTTSWLPNYPEIELYTNMFQIGQKMFTIPPHYYLVAVLTMLLLIQSINFKEKLQSYLWSIFLILNLAWCHPYMTILLLGYLFSSQIIQTLLTRKISLVSVKHLFLLSSIAIAIIGYYYYLNTYIWKGDQVLVATKNLQIINYVLSIGIVFFLSVPILFTKYFWRHSLLVRIFMWGIIPFVFLSLNLLGMPFSPTRLFQSYQQIPFSILAAVFCIFIIRKIKYSKLRIIFVFIISSLYIFYAIPQYLGTSNYYLYSHHAYYRWFNDINSTKSVFVFLNNLQEKNVTVLAPPEVSAYLPAFTNVRVIAGQGGVNPQFALYNQQIYKFYGGLMTTEEVNLFLAQHKIRYIIFGIESLQYSEVPYHDQDNLTVVFADGRVTLLEVQNPSN